MRMHEIVNEGDFGIKTGINAVKSLFKSKPAVPAAKPVDPAAALRADQDARLMAIGKGTRAAQFNPGDVVNVNLRAYKNQPQFAMSKDFPFKGRDSEIAKVIKIEPHPISKDSMIATVEVAPQFSTRQEPIMHRGQNLGYKTVPQEAERFTIPVEFISKRAQ
jgi:hypothetical protein